MENKTRSDGEKKRPWRGDVAMWLSEGIGDERRRSRLWLRLEEEPGAGELEHIHGEILGTAKHRRTRRETREQGRSGTESKHEKRWGGGNERAPRESKNESFKAGEESGASSQGNGMQAASRSVQRDGRMWQPCIQSQCVSVEVCLRWE